MKRLFLALVLTACSTINKQVVTAAPEPVPQLPAEERTYSCVRCIAPPILPLININTATLEQLQWLPWITQRLAALIVAARPLANFDDVRAKVKGWPEDPTAVLGLHVRFDGPTTATKKIALDRW